MKLAFVIPGQPVPYQRVATNGRQRFTAPKSRVYMQAVALRSMQALGQAKRSGLSWPLDARYSVELVVHNADRRVRDLDNVAKNLDGCKGILWNDDAQIDVLRIERAAVDKVSPRLVVRVEVLT